METYWGGLWGLRDDFYPFYVQNINKVVTPIMTDIFTQYMTPQDFNLFRQRYVGIKDITISPELKSKKTLILMK